MRNATKLDLAAIFKRNNFFQILFQKCKCIYVLQLWAEFYWKIPLGKWFFKFWSYEFFRETEIRFWLPFWNETFFWSFFLLTDFFFIFRNKFTMINYMYMNNSLGNSIFLERQTVLYCWELFIAGGNKFKPVFLIINHCGYYCYSSGFYLFW